MIERLSAEKKPYKISELCHALGVSRSSYYQQRRRRQQRAQARALAQAELKAGTVTPLARLPAAAATAAAAAATDGGRLLESARLQAAILHAHACSRGLYGSPRLTALLRREGWRCGENRVARLMARAGLRGVRKRRFRPRTTVSDPRLAPARDLLRELGEKPRRPDEVWVADITYLPTAEGWLYLAAVMDLGTRRIIAHACAPSLGEEMVHRALRQALQSRQPKAGVMHHSDRGCQYTSRATRRLLADWRLKVSNSAKGDCYANAEMESFWSTLKSELEVDERRFGSHDQARLAVFDYIEVFYNRQRLHSSLGYLSPLDYERSLN